MQLRTRANYGFRGAPEKMDGVLMKFEQKLINEYFQLLPRLNREFIWVKYQLLEVIRRNFRFTLSKNPHDIPPKILYTPAEAG